MILKYKTMEKVNYKQFKKEFNNLDDKQQWEWAFKHKEEITLQLDNDNTTFTFDEELKTDDCTLFVFDSDIGDRDGILYLLSREYDGELIEIRYPSETTDDGFIEFLEKTELAVQNTVTEVGAGYVSVLLLCFSEDLDILERVENYPVLMDVTWYRADGDLPSQQVLEKAGITACKLKLIGPYPVLPVSKVYRQVNRSYFDSFGESLGFFDATIYVSCWVLALSVIEAKSLKTSTIVDVLPSVASNYSGITGFCNFDLEGDRNKLDMELWGYFQIDDVASRYRCGSYFASNKTIKWRIE